MADKEIVVEGAQGDYYMDERCRLGEEQQFANSPTSPVKESVWSQGKKLATFSGILIYHFAIFNLHLAGYSLFDSVFPSVVFAFCLLNLAKIVHHIRSSNFNERDERQDEALETTVSVGLQLCNWMASFIYQVGECYIDLAQVIFMRLSGYATKLCNSNYSRQSWSLQESIEFALLITTLFVGIYPLMNFRSVVWISLCGLFQYLSRRTLPIPSIAKQTPFDFGGQFSTILVDQEGDHEYQ